MRENTNTISSLDETLEIYDVKLCGNDVNTKFKICILVFCRLQLEVYAGKKNNAYAAAK